jgi:hypothetical protein
MSDLPDLLQWLSDKLDVSVRPTPPSENNGFDAYYLDLSRFRLRLSERTPCFVVDRDALRKQTSAQLKRWLFDNIRAKGWHRRNTLVLVDGDAHDLKVMTRSEPLPPIILDRASQNRILGGSANSNLLIEEISKQAPIASLSPYETVSPVVGEQFFGRETELRHITHATMASYLVVGNRRMGKTSLLQESRRRMMRDSASGEAQVYIDCSIHRNPLDLYADIARELSAREVERVYNDNTFSIQSFIQRMARAKKEKIVLFLDEIDSLLDWDSRDNWTVISSLRAATMNVGHHDGERDGQPLRVIMAGFRRAQMWSERRDTPLYNFASPLRVKNFDFRVTEQLVIEPMLNLGLTLVDRAGLVGRIHKETGGQPNLIQHYCQFIVRKLEQDETREVTPEMLDAAVKDEGIRRRVAAELIANATNLEQLIVFIYIERDANMSAKFTLSETDTWIQEYGVQLPRSDIEEALDALETSGLLMRDGKFYGYAFSMLPRVLVENWEPRYQIDKILQEGV